MNLTQGEGHFAGMLNNTVDWPVFKPEQIAPLPTTYERYRGLYDYTLEWCNSYQIFRLWLYLRHSW